MKRIWLATLLAVTPLQAADPGMPVARYAYLTPGSTHAQRHPLQTTLAEAHFPQEIATVGDALKHLLNRSGYRLDEPRSHWARTILMPQPLPEVHRQLGPIHLVEALSILTGNAWRLKINPLYRTLVIQPNEPWLTQLRQSQPMIEAEQTVDLAPPVLIDSIAAEPSTDLRAPTSLNDPAEIMVEEMLLQEALDLLVPAGWKVRSEVSDALLRTRVSLIASSTWWKALTELTEKLSRQTRQALNLHVFEDQQLVVLEQG